MNPNQEKLRSQENLPAASSAELAQQPDGALTEQMEGVEGNVAEIAKTDASKGPSGQQSDDGQQAQDQHQDDATQDDRAALRAHLLENAPKEAVMKSQVEKVLLEKKEQLESDIKKHRKKKNYHMLSIAVMQLRVVARQLEELAKASYEAMKEMWLKVVHKFA